MDIIYQTDKCLHSYTWLRVNPSIQMTVSTKGIFSHFWSHKILESKRFGHIWKYIAIYCLAPLWNVKSDLNIFNLRALPNEKNKYNSVGFRYGRELENRPSHAWLTFPAYIRPDNNYIRRFWGLKLVLDLQQSVSQALASNTLAPSTGCSLNPGISCNSQPSGKFPPCACPSWSKPEDESSLWGCSPPWSSRNPQKAVAGSRYHPCLVDHPDIPVQIQVAKNYVIAIQISPEDVKMSSHLQVWPLDTLYEKTE